MPLLNIAIERGSGGFSQLFDFSEILGLIPLTGNELVHFRVEEKVSPRILKKSLKDGGSDEEISFDLETGTVSAHLTEEEKNYQIPDSGYQYKLIFNGTSGSTTYYYGDITVSGEPPAEDELVAAVAYQNGSASKIIAVNTSLGGYDDTVYGNTNSADVTATLPAASSMPGKRYRFYNAGDNSFIIKNSDASTLVTLQNLNDNCQVESDGSVWKIFFA